MPKKSPAPVAAAKPAVPEEAAKAFAEVEPQLAALAPSDLQPITIDIPRAVAIAVGAVPHIAKLRSRAAKLPDFDIASIDRLGTYALAAWYAHLLALPQAVPSDLARLLADAKPLRERMLLSAELLAHAGFFRQDAVTAIRAGQGNLDTANDLVALAALFTANWAQVENKSPVEWNQVEQAALLGPRILVALGIRDQPGVKAPGAADPSERRVRAFTLFVRAYDACRRAVTYLRWEEDDVDDIAPSLFANRGPRKVAASEDASAAPAEPAASPTVSGLGDG